MPAHRRAAWAHLEELSEANLLGKTHYVNDHIFQTVPQEITIKARYKEVATWKREGGTSPQGGVNEIHQGFCIYPSPSDPDDPLSIALLVEQLLRLQWDTYLTSTNITPFLEKRYPQISWNHYIVGRILGGLSSACEDHTLPNDQATPHIFKVRTKGLTKYAITISVHTWNYLRAVRNAMSPLIHDRIDYLTPPPAERKRKTDPRDQTWVAIYEIGYAGRVTSD